MDRNFIFAILLSILVIIVYSSPQYQKRFGNSVPVTEQVTETAGAESQAPKAPSESISSKPKPESQAPAELSETEKQPSTAAETALSQLNAPASQADITLENDDVSIVISPRGGTICKVSFKNYEGSEENVPAQMVTEGQAWYDGTVTDGDIELDMKSLIFSTEKESAGEATLNAELTGGRKITHHFKLNESGFLVNASTSLDGPWSKPKVRFTWHGPVNETEVPYKALRIWPFSMMMRDDRLVYKKMVYLGDGTRTTVINGKEKNKNKRIFQKEDHAQKIDAKKPGNGEDYFSGDLQWYAVRNKYFISIVIPEETSRWNAISAYRYEDGEKWFDFAVEKNLSDGVTDMDIYVGPMSYDILKSYNRDLTEAMELSFRFVRPLSILFLKIIKMMRTIIPNWGLVIILFSLLIKVVLYPLTKNMYHSMRKMSSLQPQINELREKYQNNPQQLQKETMELYKREGVNPFSGCFPMLLQMPVFFALYPVVGRAFELRQAMFIPHWIEDLSRPDPFYILPIAFGISMFFQSKQTMKDPNQKAMLYIMPVMMVILFANFSAGLTLYWFMFNIMTSIQQKLQRSS